MKEQLLYIVLFCSICQFYAQENNYWFHNYGSGSFLKGGVEVGGVTNTSAIFYNPAALAHLEGEFFEAQADVISFDNLTIENGAGTGTKIQYSILDANPTLFAYKKSFSKNPNCVYGVGIITKSFSNIAFNATQTRVADILEPSGTEDVFSGKYTYYNRIRENWVVGSFSYKASSRLAFGISTILSLRVQDYAQSYNANVVPKSELDSGNVIYSKTALVDNSEELAFRSLGFIFKPSVSLRFNHLRFGLTLTTPNLSLGLLRNSASRSYRAYLPDVLNNTIQINGSNDFYAGIYKTPWIIDFGSEFDVDDWSFALSLIWHSKIAAYQMLRVTDRGKKNTVGPPIHPNFAIPIMGSKSVINAGVAVVKQLNEEFSFAGSFRTDFNQLDGRALNTDNNFVPTFTYWDIYHITAGINWSRRRTDLSFGLNYGINNSRGDRQIINMTDATQENALLGTPLNNANTSFDNIGLVIGFYYNIDRLQGLKSNDTK